MVIKLGTELCPRGAVEASAEFYSLMQEKAPSQRQVLH
jgi:hypothetical protein